MSWRKKKRRDHQHRGALALIETPLVLIIHYSSSLLTLNSSLFTLHSSPFTLHFSLITSFSALLRSNCKLRPRRRRGHRFILSHAVQHLGVDLNLSRLLHPLRNRRNIVIEHLGLPCAKHCLS